VRLHLDRRGRIGKRVLQSVHCARGKSEIAGLDQYLFERGGFSLKALAVGVKCNSKPLGFGPAAFASQGDSGVIITKMVDNEPQQFLGQSAGGDL